MRLTGLFRFMICWWLVLVNLFGLGIVNLLVTWLSLVLVGNCGCLDFVCARLFWFGYLHYCVNSVLESFVLYCAVFS